MLQLQSDSQYVCIVHGCYTNVEAYGRMCDRCTEELDAMTRPQYERSKSRWWLPWAFVLACAVVWGILRWMGVP